jgi:tetratricopeptide (TPR) repeat protein
MAYLRKFPFAISLYSSEIVDIRMKPTCCACASHIARLALVTAMLLLIATPVVRAQRGGPGAGSSQATVVVRVEAPDGGPFDGSADVSMSTSGAGGALHDLTRDQGQAEFNGVAMGTYYVTVTANGYKPAEGQVEVGESMGGAYTTWIRLEEDTGATAGAKGSGRPMLAPKARKLLEQGVEALRASKLDEAQKQLQAAYKLAPGSPDVNYFLGYAFLQKQDLPNAENYLTRATSLDQHYADAFVALGQVRLQQGDLASAASTLQQATTIDPENWMAHWALASIDLKQSKYEDARNEAQIAVQNGKGAANGAEIIIGEAWAGSGDIDKAIDALNSFLRDAPGNSAAPTAQAMIAKLTSEKNGQEIRAMAIADLARPASTATAGAAEKASRAKGPTTVSAIPGLSDSEANLALPNWAPSDVDKMKPAVATGVACSLPEVLEKVGARVQALLTNVGNIDATEQLVHEQLNQLGKPVETAKVRYDYIATFTEGRSGAWSISEHRNGMGDAATFPANIATPGLISMALVFHPSIQGDFQMTCEGRGDWRGRPAWIIYFRQRDGVRDRVSAFVLNGSSHPISLKGRAWITADSFEIAHMDTDMIRPMPEVQLALQHISVDYKPAHFAAQGQDLWLPANADLYFEFRKQRYHRRDSFSHYKLFSVSSTQVIKQPPAAGPDQ